MARGIITACCLVALALPGAAPAGEKPRAPDGACASASAAIVDAATLRGARASVLCVVNRERAARGLARVRAIPSLGRAARHHSGDMLGRRYFSHVSPGGQTMHDRARRARYAGGRPPRELGETLACVDPTQATAEQLVALLLASAPHRGVVLDPAFRDVGIGLARGMPARGPGGAGATLTLLFGLR